MTKIQFNKMIEKIFKFFSSIQLAIFILVSLGIMSAAGTILEARYDTTYAQKVIYHSTFMYFIMALLCVNLINVMIDRWPWKAHHTGFVLAHVGIILLVVGSLITRLYGIDGNMIFDIGQSNRFISLNEPELAIYASYGDGNHKFMDATNRDFFVHRPSPNKPFLFHVNNEIFKVKDYYMFALRESKIIESNDPYSGPAVRVQLQNDRVNVTQWLMRSRQLPATEINLGPAKIIFADKSAQIPAQEGNYVVIRNLSESELSYEIYTARLPGKVQKGRLPIAEAVPTGWMGLELRVFKYIPHAEEKISYVKKERPTGLTQPAVLIEYNNQEQWLGLNTTARFFTQGLVYLVAYRNRMIDLGFEMKLTNFSVGHYEGTRQAKSYESVVEAPGLGQTKISMNEPLKLSGYTFYQASFQEDQSGQPTTSILSVNKDPGRPMKYFGSFILVLGTIVMFYFKKYRLKIFPPKAN